MLPRREFLCKMLDFSKLKRVCVQREGEVWNEEKRHDTSAQHRRRGSGSVSLPADTNCTGPRLSSWPEKAWCGGDWWGAGPWTLFACIGRHWRGGGEAYTCTAPTASAPSCRTTDHAPAAAPHHSVLFISAHLTLPFLLFLRNFLVDNVYATRSDTFMSYEEKAIK